MANILIGITGGIAAYKAINLARLFQKNGDIVKVIATHSALQFVGEITFRGLGIETASDEFRAGDPLAHINLAKWADIFIIAPATANTIAKIANGIGDNLLTSCVLAYNKSLIICPAMNGNMYTQEITQINIDKLKTLDINIIEPAYGELACKDIAIGKLQEPEIIFHETIRLTTKDRILRNLKVLVTAGPTMEPIDPARYISNRSSGKMGYALAESAYIYGADVLLISGPTKLTSPIRNTIYIKTADEMYQQVIKYIDNIDILIMTAAVADYKPIYSHQKIKKDDASMIIELEKNIDILKTVGQQKKITQYFVGFAAESERIQDYAMKKLKEKNLDMIIANDITKKDTGFDTDENEVTIYTKKGKSLELNKNSKIEISKKILIEIAKDLNSKSNIL